MNALDRPLTCKLTTPELQKRRTTVIAELKKVVLAKAEVREGLKLTFPGTDECLDQLIGFIKSERLCCDFFVFNLTVSNENAVLEITGPEGSKEFLEHEVGF